MTQLEQALILTELADRMIAQGSWCGHTHLQKATYFLQELLGVPLGVQYILYKHGPYSFDLEEVVTWAQAKYLFEQEFKAIGYGPRLKPTETSREHRKRFPRLLGRYAQPIHFVAQKMGAKGVAELEKLATALYVTRESGNAADKDLRAQRLHELKPHVSLEDARAAVEEYDCIALEAKAVTRETPHV